MELFTHAIEVLKTICLVIVSIEIVGVAFLMWLFRGDHHALDQREKYFLQQKRQNEKV